MGQTRDEAAGDRIDNASEDDRHSLAKLLQLPYDRAARGEDDIRRSATNSEA